MRTMMKTGDTMTGPADWLTTKAREIAEQFCCAECLEEDLREVAAESARQVRAEIGCTSYAHMWKVAQAYTEPDVDQFCMCASIQWQDRAKPHLRGYKTVGPLNTPPVQAGAARGLTEQEQQHIDTICYVLARHLRAIIERFTTREEAMR